MAQYIEYTEEEKQRANRVDLVDFLKRRGERLTRSGHECRWVYHDSCGEHDSITILNNEWYDHKNRCGGKTIDFLRQKLGYSFKDAIAELLGSGSYYRETEYTLSLEKERKPFVLPKPNTTNCRAFAYLNTTRCIDTDIIRYFTKEKLIYEDSDYHNVVFVGKNENNVPAYAHAKSTTSDCNFRSDVLGSNKNYAFHYIGNSERLFVFESATDLLSFISMNKQNWQQDNYIALGGVADKALFHLLSYSPDITEITLCLDNDNAGQEAARQIAGKLQKQEFDVKILVPEYKDWNEDLIVENLNVGVIKYV